MSEQAKIFLKQAEKVAFDREHRSKINYNMSVYDRAFAKGKLQFEDIELVRKRAANLKHRIVNELDKYLIEFERNFQKRGGKVIWAQDKKEAIKEILAILAKHEVTTVVKSKSMITEEIDLNGALEKKKIESVETDLGEYIVQLAGEKPYHIITPAMHKSKEDVSALFHEKFDTPENASPPEITAFVREKLRQKFLSAEAGITGANFLLADVGGICLTENEGNALMSVSYPKIHIVIAGIEKLIPSVHDLHLFWPLLSTHGSGQKISVYNTILLGPKKDNETDGPEKMYVVLLENNRTELLKEERQRQALSCIRCGACLNVCPVYKNIGGYTYNTTYSGPIGSVISPYMLGQAEYKHLSYASSLCGACTDICPVKIPLHELLLLNRNDAVKKGLTSKGERFVMRKMKRTMMKRSKMNRGSGMKNFAFKRFFKKQWGPRREVPVFQPKTFNQLWKKKNSAKIKQ